MENKKLTCPVCNEIFPSRSFLLTHQKDPQNGDCYNHQNTSFIPGWVKKDIDLMRFINRIEKRTSRYPNWRQVYWDCNGMCQYPVENGICGEMKGIEYHEIYNSDGDVSQIVLLCNYHHNSIHNGIVNERRYQSMSARDIEIEMMLSGNADEWKKKFNIIDRSVTYDFEIESKQLAVDLEFSENN